MCENNLSTIEQFGFWRGHSTELAAIQLVKCWWCHALYLLNK